MIYIRITKGKYEGHYGEIDLNNYCRPDRRRVKITTVNNPIATIESPDDFDIISEEEYTVARIMAL